LLQGDGRDAGFSPTKPPSSRVSLDIGAYAQLDGVVVCECAHVGAGALPPRMLVGPFSRILSNLDGRGSVRTVQVFWSRLDASRPSNIGRRKPRSKNPSTIGALKTATLPCYLHLQALLWLSSRQVPKTASSLAWRPHVISRGFPWVAD